jgi:probable F420-dependent oxidoreductase
VVKIDTGLGFGMAGARRAAVQAEAAGYDGLWTTETRHDPFCPLVVAAEHTERIELGTAVAIAFARTPMTVAMVANDLQTQAGGRFILGLGSQVRAHVVDRFGMPWSAPAARMREFVLALRAIWACWATDTPLEFEGEFYRHTLMTPFFAPGANPYGNPKVFLAGVGARMTEVAGEVADGFFCHSFMTESYFRSVTLPALARGRAKAGLTMAGFEISGPSFIVTGMNADEQARAASATRQQIAFYGSTPAYRAVLDHHGWDDLHRDLHGLSQQGRWSEMGGLVDDEVLDAFAIVAEPEEVGPKLQARYGDVVHRVSVDAHDTADPARWRALTEAIRAGAHAA